MRTPHGSPLSFRTVHRLLSWCSSYTKYSQTTLWRFLPDNSFTRLILPDILSQSMEWTECLISPCTSSYFARLQPPSPPSFSWQSSILLSLSISLFLSLFPSLCLSVCLCLSLPLSLYICIYIHTY